MKEWALIGALNGGEIPASHRLVQEEPITVRPEVWNPAIYEAGLRTQNYDKGFDRFVRKFDPELPTEAVMSIAKGVHKEFGSAVLFTQENRRCLLLETLHEISEEEALWYTMFSWAKFQPRRQHPRQEPGRLYYPAQYSHVFEKYWDTLHQPLAHPGSADETFFTKACMQEFASALAGQDLSDFAPLVDSEANHQCVSIAHQAAVSHLCMIQDARDFWEDQEKHRSSAVTDGPSSLGSSVVGTESVTGLGLTDTCEPGGLPSQT
jgi:hypothetical protein